MKGFWVLILCQTDNSFHRVSCAEKYLEIGFHPEPRMLRKFEKMPKGTKCQISVNLNLHEPCNCTAKLLKWVALVFLPAVTPRLDRLKITCLLALFKNNLTISDASDCGKAMT